MGNANPMRWNCSTHGCFNQKKRPRLEQLAECLPGRCQFGDVDGFAEINGHGLFLEWKPNTEPLPTGQHIAYKNISTTGLISVLVVAGNPATMEVTSYAKYIAGEFHPGNQLL